MRTVPPRALVAAAVAIAMVATVLAPTGTAGEPGDPELTDPCESWAEDGSDPTNVSHTAQHDVQKAWIEPNRGPFTRDNLVIRLCHDLDTNVTLDDPTEVPEWQAGGAQSKGWIFNLTDGQNRRWEVRAWIGQVEFSFVPSPGNYDLRQKICPIDPSSRLQSDTESEGQQDAFGNDYPKLRGNKIVLGFPTSGMRESRPLWNGFYQDLHVEGGTFVEPGTMDCGSDFNVTDRAPDEGFGAPLDIEIPTQIQTLGVVMKTPDAHEQTILGRRGNWTFDLGNAVQETRNVSLSASAPIPLDLSFQDPVRSIEKNENASLTLFARVPSDVPLGTVPVTVTGDVSRGRDSEPLGTFEFEVDLTVQGFQPELTVDEAEEVKTARPNRTRSFDLQLENTGNLAGEYLLSVEDAPDGWATIQPTAAALDPGGTSDARVTLEIPGDTELGAYDFTAVVRSQLTPETSSVDLRASVQNFVDPPTAVGAPMEYLPAPGPAVVLGAFLAAAALIRRRFTS